MQAYCGQVSAGSRKRRELEALGIGELLAPPKSAPPVRFPFAVDNGAWAAHQQGKTWDPAWLLRTLAAVERAALTPVFVVCPDVVAGGLASLAHSLTWAPRLSMWPLYLAVQDGLTEDEVLPHLVLFRGLFVGGSTRWKVQTGARWVALAHAHGRAAHIGRCATPRRTAWAIRIGADSIDGNQALWTRAALKRWAWTLAQRQGELL